MTAGSNFWATLEWPLEGRPTLFSFTLCVSEYNVIAFVIAFMSMLIISIL